MLKNLHSRGLLCRKTLRGLERPRAEIGIRTRGKSPYSPLAVSTNPSLTELGITTVPLDFFTLS